MKQTTFLTLACGLAVLCAAASPARAEVTGVDVKVRAAVGTSGYEKIVGTVHFALDPKDPRNAVIADLDKAPVNADGKVEFSADLYIMRPLDPAKSNGVAFVDVVNRGNKTILRFSRSTAASTGDETTASSACPAAPAAPAPGASARTPADPTADLDLGDGFLTDRGFTLVWVGWQFDVRRRGASMTIDVPRAKGVTAPVSAVFTPCDRRPSQTVADLQGYPALDPDAADTVLTVRDGVFGTPETVAKAKWSLKGNVVTMPEGFTPGRIYEIRYRSSDPPIAGVGLAGFRDLASWLKYAPDALAPARYAYTFGSSQSGRFLRAFLYDGFNTDERGRQVYDAVMAHIAGAARLDINRRGGTPNALSMFSSSTFPFATGAQRDPISGRTDGLLENPRARDHQPKIFFTNSSVEQWGGGRAAPLITTSADGKSDVPLAANVRYYYFAGTQHSPGRFPPRVVTGQQPYNPVDYWWSMRALFVAMDDWVRKGAEPPASQYPKLSDGTLVPIAQVAFPTLPGVHSPKSIPAGRQDGKPIPFLVPQVDADGNDRAGVRLPEQAVPLATFTGWNFRNVVTGGPEDLVNLLGSAIPLARTRAAREAAHDPRPSIEERYGSAEQYQQQVKAAADRLVQGRYLLPQDETFVLDRAHLAWTFALTGKGAE
jgi:hypothetical protein